MFNSLDASGFKGSVPFYKGEFEELLSKLIACYRLMIDNQTILENDENKIRDVLLWEYLQNDHMRDRIGLAKWHFEGEVPENRNVGRTDIKVISEDTFKKQEAYYILECKRLNKTNTTGKTGLNAKYIKNGICRFTSNYYKSYHRVNGMIGFVTEELDIHDNVSRIDKLLSSSFKEANTVKQITKDSFIMGFDYHYHSIHLCDTNGELKIYHLMFDFNRNMCR